MSSIKEFLKPNLWKVILFIILIFGSYLILVYVNPRIFPCSTLINPLVERFSPRESYKLCGFCNFKGWFSGICGYADHHYNHTPGSIIMLIIILLILPYLVSCGIVSLIRRKKK